MRFAFAVALCAACGDPVTEPPGEPQHPGATPRPVPLGQDQRRHRRQVVGIGRVAEPEERRDQRRARQSVHVLFCGLMSPHSGPALTVISSASAGSVSVAVARSVP